VEQRFEMPDGRGIEWRNEKRKDTDNFLVTVAMVN
jgi:hypothetical protein